MFYFPTKFDLKRSTGSKVMGTDILHVEEMAYIVMLNVIGVKITQFTQFTTPTFFATFQQACLQGLFFQEWHVSLHSLQHIGIHSMQQCIASFTLDIMHLNALELKENGPIFDTLNGAQI